MVGGKLRKFGKKREISMFDQFSKYKKNEKFTIDSYIQTF